MRHHIHISCVQDRRAIAIRSRASVQCEECEPCADRHEQPPAPTPEALKAFAAMDRFTEELVKAGVFVAAAGLKNTAEAKRIVYDGASRTACCV